MEVGFTREMQNKLTLNVLAHKDSILPHFCMWVLVLDFISYIYFHDICDILYVGFLKCSTFLLVHEYQKYYHLICQFSQSHFSIFDPAPFWHIHGFVVESCCRLLITRHKGCTDVIYCEVI